MEQRNYYGFRDWDDVQRQFEANIGPEPEFVYATYITPPYEGHATVVFVRDGKWWMASGSHCSCYGLEGQWDPEEFSPSAHLAGRADGKNIVCIIDDCDYPQVTQAAFDAWLEWAVKREEEMRTQPAE